MTEKRHWNSAKKCEYDLVLLDVMLPKLDGFAGMPADPGVFGYADCYADGKE